MRYVEAKHEWRDPSRILVVQLGTDANEAKVFRAHAAPQRLCENLINALKLLNEPADGWRQPDSEHCNGGCKNEADKVSRTG